MYSINRCYKTHFTGFSTGLHTISDAEGSEELNIVSAAAWEDEWGFEVSFSAMGWPKLGKNFFLLLGEWTENQFRGQSATD